MKLRVLGLQGRVCISEIHFFISKLYKSKHSIVFLLFSTELFLVHMLGKSNFLRTDFFFPIILFCHYSVYYNSFNSHALPENVFKENMCFDVGCFK